MSQKGTVPFWLVFERGDEVVGGEGVAEGRPSAPLQLAGHAQRARHAKAPLGKPALVLAREDLARRPVGDDARLVEHDHAVGARGVLHAVRDLDERDAKFAEAPEHAAQHRAPARVQPCGRLVQHQDARLHREDAGERAEAPLPAGELERRGLAPVGEAHQLKGARHAASHLVRREAEVARSKRDVFLDRLRKELALGVLHDVADGAARLLAVATAREVAAAHEDAPLVGGLEPAEQPEQGRLARAGLPDDRRRGAGGNLKRHVLQRVAARPIREGRVFDLQNGDGFVCAAQKGRVFRPCGARAHCRR